MNTEQVLQALKDEEISFVNLWFVDIFGELHRLGMPSYAIDKSSFEHGLEKLDASSIVGFKTVNNSDMVLKPDPNSFRILPNDYDPGQRKNAIIFCDLYEGNTTKEIRYNRDSRGIAQKAATDRGCEEWDRYQYETATERLRKGWTISCLPMPYL